jgi:excisionase family DNA binding protein
VSDGDTFPSIVLTVPETARALRIGRNQADEAVRRGELPSIRVGRRILIPRQAIEHLLDGSVIDSRMRAPTDDSHAS